LQEAFHPAGSNQHSAHYSSQLHMDVIGYPNLFVLTMLGGWVLHIPFFSDTSFGEFCSRVVRLLQALVLTRAEKAGFVGVVQLFASKLSS